MYVIGTNCLDEGFLLHVITGRHYFLFAFTVTLKFFYNRHVVAFFENVFKEICVLHYLHNSILILIPKIQNKTAINNACQIFLILHIFLYKQDLIQNSSEYVFYYEL